MHGEGAGNAPGGPSDANIVCTGGTPAAIVPGGEEVVVGAVFEYGTGFDGSAVGGASGERDEGIVERFSSSWVEPRNRLVFQ